MKKLSQSLLADLVATKRKEQNMTQQALADATGIYKRLIPARLIFFSIIINTDSSFETRKVL